MYEVEFNTHTIRVWDRVMPLKAMERQLYNMECIFSGARENSHLLYSSENPQAAQEKDVNRDLGFPFSPTDNPFLTDISPDNPIYTVEQQKHLINRQTEISYIANKRRYLNPIKSPSPYSQLPPLNNEHFIKSNSTSSVWTNPHPVLGLNDVLSGTAELIYTHITHRLHHDLAMMASEQVAFAFEESTYTGKPSEQVTEPKHVEAFMRHAFELAKFQPETCIVTLIFLNRFLNRTNIPLHSGNWKPIFIICLVLSQKMSDDTPLINKDFAIIYPAITAQTVNVLERSMITLLEFDLHIPLQTYINYFMDVALVTKTNIQRRDMYSKQQHLWSKLVSQTRQPTDPDVARSLEMRRQGHSGETDTHQNVTMSSQQQLTRRVRSQAFDDMMRQLQNPQPLTLDLLFQRNRELEHRRVQKMEAVLQTVEQLRTNPNHIDHPFTNQELQFPELIKNEYVPPDLSLVNPNGQLEDPLPTTIGFGKFTPLPRLVPSLDDPIYSGLSRSIYDGIPPIIGRYEASRVHWTEFYSRNRAYWKKLVMTPEGLSSAGRSQYRVLA